MRSGENTGSLLAFLSVSVYRTVLTVSHLAVVYGCFSEIYIMATGLGYGESISLDEIKLSTL